MTTDQAEITRGRKLSGIWIIPLLALVLGIYMVVHSWMTQGPEIEIAFSTANGLEQGKTRIKYRNVDMGLVEEVRLNDKFDGVIAKVKMDRQALPLLREDTRFWVVTARVGVGSISGLETLLSGAYVQLAPGTSKKDERSFTALEQPPLTPTGAPGLRLQLTSEHATSVSAGDTVLYKGYSVGRVESMEFDPSEAQVRYVIFIDAPYHELVNGAVRFWDASGISLSAGAEGFKVSTGSLDTILLGGVAFGLPDGIAAGDAVSHNTEFKLYSNYEDIIENPFKTRAYYVVSFPQSVKGLAAGAPVEYRGRPIGRVERILFKEGQQQSSQLGEFGKGEAIPVLIYVEPGRMELPDQESSVATVNRIVTVGVSNGMRATLGSGNLLTGSKYVDIDYYPDADAAEAGSFMQYKTIPTMETGLGQLESKLNSILSMIDALPLDETVASANSTIKTLNETLESMHVILQSESTQKVPDELNTTLQELREAVSGLAPSSEAYQSINSSLLRLNRTLGNLDSLTRTLSGQPNAVLLPSAATPDPIPEVKSQ